MRDPPTARPYFEESAGCADQSGNEVVANGPLGRAGPVSVLKATSQQAKWLREAFRRPAEIGDRFGVGYGPRASGVCPRR